MWNWLFSRNKKASDLEVKMNELKIGFLTIILCNLEISKKSDCTSIIEKVEKIKSDLECSSVIDLTEVINLFKPPSVLKNIAVENNWEDQYLHIEKRYEEFNRQ
ncbi:hypothetical protein HQQ94_07305 [Shewanella sp. VB17]|uniref:hypothetical protein n=1 Tax=Shewanella sp. VB17 TaxID=2739432 RepID=UPI001565BEBA|nr:hypothetical protein [Shewanella sp. VB17]NRD73049.1 hypothetical protein [Shewanella sp. VB17]